MGDEEFEISVDANGFSKYVHFNLVQNIKITGLKEKEEDSNIKTIYNCGTHNEQKTESIVEKTGYNRHEIGQNKYEDTDKDIRKNIKENVNAEDFLKMNCVTMLTDPKQEKNRECHFRCC